MKKILTVTRLLTAVLLALWVTATALANTPMANGETNYNKGSSVENTKAIPTQPENNTGITNQTATVQRCTTAFITGATLAPDDNTGITNSMTFREAARFKDVQITGVLPDNVQLTVATQKTDGTSLPDEMLMMAAMLAQNQTDQFGNMAPRAPNNYTVAIAGATITRTRGGCAVIGLNPYDGGAGQTAPATHWAFASNSQATAATLG